jgi:hypothetical protein
MKTTEFERKFWIVLILTDKHNATKKSPGYPEPFYFINNNIPYLNCSLVNPVLAVALLTFNSTGTPNSMVLTL